MPRKLEEQESTAKTPRSAFENYVALPSSTDLMEPSDDIPLTRSGNLEHSFSLWLSATSAMLRLGDFRALNAG